MQLMTLNDLSAGLLVAVTSAGMAQELPRPPEVLRTRFCIGSGNCPVLVQVMKDCGSDADQIAQEICTFIGQEERAAYSNISCSMRAPEAEENVVSIGIPLSVFVE